MGRMLSLQSLIQPELDPNFTAAKVQSLLCWGALGVTSLLSCLGASHDTILTVQLSSQPAKTGNTKLPA